MEKLHRRLSDIGATDYRFVRDGKVSIGGSYREEKKDGSNQSDSVVILKTLVWEAVLVVPRDSGLGNGVMDEVIDHYFVTALHKEDRVDLQLLHTLVKSHTLSNGIDLSARLMLRLAERTVAESLTGFVSGTMPPIAHTSAMPLYVDDIVAEGDGTVASVGSGAEGHSLHVPMDEMLRIAAMASAVYVQPLSLSRNGPQQSLCDQGEEGEISFRQDPTLSTSSPDDDSEDGPTEMATTVGKAQRATLLRKTAKKRGNANLLRRMLDEIGDEFPSLMQIKTGTAAEKNALHFAAWKGDLDSITLLITAGKSHGLDLVNTISVGEGSYGKTPIFFALTQCRDDATLLLTSHGADLLIVNNKGQTPCSIAASHLKPETCQLLYDIEASQLQGGGTFRNYRMTHSDGKQYGDLDPRFEIDGDNHGEDIVPELEVYEQMLRNATGRDDLENLSLEERIMIATTIPGLPRCIRIPLRYRKQPRAEEDDGRKGSKEKKQIASETLTRRDRKRLHKSQSTAADETIDFDSLDTLTLDNLFDRKHSLLVVDSEEGVTELVAMIDKSVAAAETKIAQETELGDEDLIANSWGLDCEWQPSRSRGHETPVATLQLSHASTGTSYLVDVQSLLQPSIKDATAPMTEIERTLSHALTKIFSSQHIAILGFGISQDLGKLAASFPHIPCFCVFQNVIDLHTVSRNIYLGKAKTYTSSLQKMVARLLNKNLSKVEQCSEWQIRPLRPSQLSYACLDAAVLPVLLEIMICQGNISDIFAGGFLHRHPHLCVTMRMTCLGTEGSIPFLCKPQQAYHVPYGSAKVHLSLLMARQVWTTGKESPDPPSMLSIERQRSIANSESNGKETNALRKSNDESSSGSRAKMKTLKLSKVSFSQIPRPGEVIGYTKDACLHSLLGEEFVDSLAVSMTRLGFNRRGGIIPMANGFALFVNFARLEGKPSSHWLYRNDFLEEGRKLTFSVNIDREQEKGLVDRFSAQREQSESVDRQRVFVFARMSTKEKYISLGEVKAAEQATSEYENVVNLVLELEDYDELCKGNESRFMEMVRSHAKCLAEERALQ